MFFFFSKRKRKAPSTASGFACKNKDCQDGEGICTNFDAVPMSLVKFDRVSTHPIRLSLTSCRSYCLSGKHLIAQAFLPSEISPSEVPAIHLVGRKRPLIVVEPWRQVHEAVAYFLEEAACDWGGTIASERSEQLRYKVGLKLNSRQLALYNLFFPEKFFNVWPSFGGYSTVKYLILQEQILQ
jgi:hypothetical protein